MDATIPIPSRTYSRSETGHAKNLANFQLLIQRCEHMDDYSPSAAYLSLTALRDAFDASTLSFVEAHDCFISFSQAVDDRQNGFAGLKKLVTRIMGAVSVSGLSENELANFKTLNNKLQGKPPKTSTNEQMVLQEVMEARSNSQQSYDQTADFFRQLVGLLEATALYQPNETELTVVQLKLLMENLYALNAAVGESRVLYSRALIKRNDLLYKDAHSIYELAKMVKNYMKSVLGTTDPYYLASRKIEIKRLVK